MGDGWDYQKRQQEIERNKKELERIGFAPQPDSPWIVNYRHGTDDDAEITLIADDKFRVKPMNAHQIASLIHHLSGILAHITRKK